MTEIMNPATQRLLLFEEIFPQKGLKFCKNIDHLILKAIL